MLFLLDYVGPPSTSLDDSLTNMQWLYKLDSNPLLETQKSNDTTTVAPTSMNPCPKPPYSYATLILLAINSTQEKRMTLQDIYKWIEDNFPYYKSCKKAWKVTSYICLYTCIYEMKSYSLIHQLTLTIYIRVR